jgi:Na+/alanine symporter
LQTLQEQVDQQVQMEQEQMQIQQEQQNQEQATQNSPTGQLLNSIASKIGGGNVQG